MPGSCHGSILARLREGVSFVFKRFLMASAFAIPLAFAAPAMAQTAPDIAAALQAKVGQPFASGLTLSAVVAEGNTVVFTIDGPKGWRGTRSVQQISDEFVSGFCPSGTAFFSKGVRMRFDTLEGKAAPMKGPVVSKCPG
jgi:hypothetical protein